MNFRLFLAGVLLILGYGTLYLPHWLFRQNRKLMSQELASNYPEFSGLGLRFMLYTVAIVFIWLTLFGAFIFIFQDQAGIVIFLGTFFNGIVVGNASFACVTGVYPVPIFKDYFFVYDKRVRSISLGHLTIGLAQIALGVLLTFIPWSLWAGS